MKKLRYKRFSEIKKGQKFIYEKQVWLKEAKETATSGGALLKFIVDVEVELYD